MRKIREVFRLRYELELDHRQIAGSCRLSLVTVGKYLARFAAAGLSWPLPDPAEMHRELRRKGVTLQRLWQEYRENYPEGYGYTQFVEHYRRFEQRLRPNLRQLYVAGERMSWTSRGDDPDLGPRHGPARAGAAVRGHPRGEQLHLRRGDDQPAVGGLDRRPRARLRVLRRHDEADHPGQPQVGSQPGLPLRPGSEPVLPGPGDALRHGGSASAPGPPAGQGQGRVRGADRRALDRRGAAPPEVLQPRRAQRRDPRAALGVQQPPVQQAAGDPRRVVPGSGCPGVAPGARGALRVGALAQGRGEHRLPLRRRRALLQRALPADQADGGGAADGHDDQADPPRQARGGPRPQLCQRRFHDDPEHRPKAHQRHLEWTPGRIVAWAASVGPHCAEAVRWIIESKPHPEQGYRSCLGLLRLAKTHGDERLDAACRRAQKFQTCSYRSIKSILAANLDRQPLAPEEPQTATRVHANVRGRACYN